MKTQINLNSLMSGEGLLSSPTHHKDIDFDYDQEKETGEMLQLLTEVVGHIQRCEEIWPDSPEFFNLRIRIEKVLSGTR